MFTTLSLTLQRTQIFKNTEYQKYKAVVDKLILSSGLDKGEFNRFFKRLRFHLGEPGRDLQKQLILDCLKVESSGRSTTHY